MKIAEARVWRPVGVDGLEVRHATYSRVRSVPHLHETYCITLTERGRATVSFGGAAHTVDVNDLVALNPGEVHHGGPIDAAEWECRSFYPTTDFIHRIRDEAQAGRSVRLLSHPIINEPTTRKLLRYAHVACERRNTPLERETAVVTAFRHLLAIGGTIDGGKGSGARAARLIREYIDTHAEDDITLQQLADMVGLSRTYACTMFRRQVGLSPHAYQIQARVRIAREMLARGASVANALAATGFYDQPHFTRHFKRLVGITPGRYGMGPEPTDRRI